MELVLTEKRGGGYHAHRPTCKKMGDKEQFDPEEFAPEVLDKVTACSSCKPKDDDLIAMVVNREESAKELPSAAKDVTVSGQAASDGEDDEFWDDDLLGDEDEPGAGLSQEQQALAEAHADAGTQPETLTDEELDDLAKGEALAEDLLGDEPVTPADPPKVPAERKPPKAAPAATPAKSKDGELKAEQAMELLTKVADHLGILLPEDLVFPGFGKAVKTEAKQTIYLNSKGTSDVRANSPEQASQWVEEGLAERRGGNYVRVAVRDL